MMHGQKNIKIIILFKSENFPEIIMIMNKNVFEYIMNV
jgi:hypothetical protein